MGGPKDSEVLERLGLSCTATVLVQRRLALLPSLGAPEAPAALRSLLGVAAATRWGQQWAADLKWLAGHYPGWPDPVSRDGSWRWWSWAREAPGDFKKAATKVVERRPGLDRTMEPPVWTTEAELPALLEAWGGSLWPCPECSRDRIRVAATKEALVARKTRAHGMRNPARKHVLGTVCPACGQDFRTRPRVLQHLAYSSKRCSMQMRAGALPAFSDEEVRAADLKDRPAALQAARSGHGRLWTGMSGPGPKPGGPPVAEASP